MGISIRAYAKHRGVSPSAVHKAIKTQRISPEADGTLEIATADQQWEKNTNPRRKPWQDKKAVSKAALDTVKETLAPDSASSDTTIYLQAKAANEVLKAELNRLKVRKQKKELIDKAQATAHVFALARAERDAWLNWSARIAAQMASNLNISPAALQRTLESYVREHLNELANIEPKFD